MKYIFRVFAAVVVSAAIVGCKLPQTGWGGVEGMVTDMELDSPVFSVAVSYGDSSVLTDMQGLYRFDSIPSGYQGIKFRKDGYKDTVVFVDIPIDGLVECSAALQLIRKGWAVGGTDSNFGTILVTNDGGRSWLRQGSSKMIPETKLTHVCAYSDRICWVAGEPDILRGNTTVLFTDDGGVTWNSRGTSIKAGSEPVSIEAICALGPKSCIVAARDTSLLFITTNSGTSWKNLRISGLVKSYSAISSMDGVNIWCGGESYEGGAGIDYSSDAGNTWEFISVPSSAVSGRITDIAVINEDMLVVCAQGSSSLAVSHDRGKSWSSVGGSSISSSLYSIHVHDENVWWVSGDGGQFFYTTNAADSFANIFPKSESSSSAISSFSFLKNGKSGAVVITDATGLSSKIYYTDASGMVWEEASIPYAFELLDVDFVGGSN